MGNFFKIPETNEINVQPTRLFKGSNGDTKKEDYSYRWLHFQETTAEDHNQ